MATGLLATIAGMFPAIAMKLLGFVAIYGMILMPMGAILFVDFWLLKKLGLKSNYAAEKTIDFYWAACLTYAITVAICVTLVKMGVTQIFFVSLPGSFFAAILHTILSMVFQQREGSVA